LKNTIPFRSLRNLFAAARFQLRQDKENCARFSGRHDLKQILIKINVLFSFDFRKPSLMSAVIPILTYGFLDWIQTLPNKFIRIGGFAISDCCFENVTRRIYSQIQSGSRLAVFFANTHFVVTCQPLRNRLPRMMSSVLILNDGIGVSIARRLLRRGKFACNMNGTDFVPRLLRESPKPLRVYLLGSTKTAVDGAAAAFARIPHVDIAGLCDGYSLWQKEEEIIEEINAARPDILLVAMGCPLQECWIVENFDRLNANAIFGVGALFDFVSGQAPRAPKIMRQVQLEWLYRLWREPRRLAYRYTIEIFSFLRIVFANAVDTAQTNVSAVNRHIH